MLADAVAAMSEALSRTGNASSLHSAGRRARRDVEESRERIAAAVGARPSEVVLTTGGTESDNLAVKGLFWSRHAADPRRTRVLRLPALVCQMTLLPVLDPASGDRRALATAAAAAVGGITGVHHPATTVHRSAPDAVPAAA